MRLRKFASHFDGCQTPRVLDSVLAEGMVVSHDVCMEAQVVHISKKVCPFCCVICIMDHFHDQFEIIAEPATLQTQAPNRRRLDAFHINVDDSGAPTFIVRENRRQWASTRGGAVCGLAVR